MARRNIARWKTLEFIPFVSTAASIEWVVLGSDVWIGKARHSKVARDFLDFVAEVPFGNFDWSCAGNINGMDVVGIVTLVVPFPRTLGGHLDRDGRIGLGAALRSDGASGGDSEALVGHLLGDDGLREQRLATSSSPLAGELSGQTGRKE